MWSVLGRRTSGTGSSCEGKCFVLLYGFVKLESDRTKCTHAHTPRVPKVPTCVQCAAHKAYIGALLVLPYSSIVLLVHMELMPKVH